LKNRLVISGVTSGASGPLNGPHPDGSASTSPMCPVAVPAANTGRRITVSAAAYGAMAAHHGWRIRSLCVVTRNRARHGNRTSPRSDPCPMLGWSMSRQRWAGAARAGDAPRDVGMPDPQHLRVLDRSPRNGTLPGRLTRPTWHGSFRPWRLPSVDRSLRRVLEPYRSA
jgi:hypothetical protein